MQRRMSSTGSRYTNLDSITEEHDEGFSSAERLRQQGRNNPAEQSLVKPAQQQQQQEEPAGVSQGGEVPGEPEERVEADYEDDFEQGACRIGVCAYRSEILTDTSTLSRSPASCASISFLGPQVAMITTTTLRKFLTSAPQGDHPLLPLKVP